MSRSRVLSSVASSVLAFASGCCIAQRPTAPGPDAQDSPGDDVSDPGCLSPCTVGSTTCISGSLSTCEPAAGEGCAQWGMPVPCPTGDRCSDVLGQCVQAFTYYWLIGQSPSETTAYLYARDGATVTFGGTIAAPVTITLPPDTFVSRNVGALGYTQVGTEWYFLDVTSTADTMVNFDRTVTLSTGEVCHGDGIHDKPGIALGSSYAFAYAQSGPGDDILVLYAPPPTSTTVTVHGITNSGTPFGTSVTFTGLFVSPIVSTWFGFNEGYSLLADAAPDQHFAAALFDEVYAGACAGSGGGSGYYFATAPGMARLYDEYMHIHRQAELSDYYLPGAMTLTHLDLRGTTVGTPTAYPGEESLILWHAMLGYDTATLPYLVHVRSTAPFADISTTPVATDVRATAAYMGWNASLASLAVFADAPTQLVVYDGRTATTVASYTLTGPSIRIDALDTLGFAPNQPFLMAVQANRPVYQEVSLPFLLRQYPGEIGPIVR